ncbi:MAG: NAD regulator [Alphaproteobacteria bacterium]|nr:NAD regulator [Alphaproteobacteria bacterium]
MSLPLIIGLSAVIVAADTQRPVTLVTRRDASLPALPFGAFDPVNHRTFELSLRGWVREQTGFELGYVEQLYTFGDRGRETPDAHLSSAPGMARVISVSYLALTPEAAEIDTSFDANWRNWYAFFPWEDHRNGRPRLIDAEIAPQLKSWAAGQADRLDRARLAFGFDGHAWIEERVLERYELLYEAGLVAECARDSGLPSQRPHFGEPMASDHRRILATAISRLRGKLKYRPVLFELMPERFTLSALQRTCEALLGLRLHKQNFRRALDKAELLEGTGAMETSTGGRPAELFRFRRELLRRRIVTGVATPGRRIE